MYLWRFCLSMNTKSLNENIWSALSISGGSVAGWHPPNCDNFQYWEVYSCQVGTERLVDLMAAAPSRVRTAPRHFWVNTLLLKTAALRDTLLLKNEHNRSLLPEQFFGFNSVHLQYVVCLLVYLILLFIWIQNGSNFNKPICIYF